MFTNSNIVFYSGTVQREEDTILHVDDDTIHEPHVDGNASNDNDEPNDKEGYTNVHLTSESKDPSVTNNDSKEGDVTLEEKQDHSEKNINLFKHRNFEQDTSDGGSDSDDEYTRDSEDTVTVVKVRA